MRDVEQYRELAEYLHEKSTSFFQEFPWFKELSPEQWAVHKISQQANVDCHNGFLSGIFQKMAKAPVFRLQHKSYNYITQDIREDHNNLKDTSDVPLGVILKRINISTKTKGRHSPLGRLTIETRGTLFYKSAIKNQMVSTCKVSLKEFEFEHPWFWDVPTVEEILKVFSFSEQSHLDKLMSIFRRDSEQDTTGTVMSEPEPIDLAKALKTAPQFELNSISRIDDILKTAGGSYW